MENFYTITKLGTVYSHKTGAFLKPQKTTGGYYSVSLCFNGKVKQQRIHRLVAMTYIPNPENKPEVNHKDGNKENNRVENLEWATVSENRKHAIDTGLNSPPPTHTGKFGYDHNRSIEVHLFEFDNRFYLGSHGSQAEAARVLGVHYSTINKAIKAGSKCKNKYFLTT